MIVDEIGAFAARFEVAFASGLGLSQMVALSLKGIYQSFDLFIIFDVYHFKIQPQNPPPL